MTQMIGADEGQAFADAYDHAQGPDGDGKKIHTVFPLILAELRGRRVSSALDVGCGNGSFGRYCAGHGLQVDGLDVCAPLLDKARSRDRAAARERSYFHEDSADITAEVLRRYTAFVCIFSLQDMPFPSRFFARVAAFAETGSIILAAGESYFHLTSHHVPHTVERRREPCTGFDEARFRSFANWCGAAEGTTYCRRDADYRLLAGRAGLTVTGMLRFGTSAGWVGIANPVWPPSRPFFLLRLIVGRKNVRS